MGTYKEQGRQVTIHGRAQILTPERVVLGSHVIVDDFVFFGSHRELIIGNFVHIACHASITGGGECLVADFAGISSGARILTGTDDFDGEALTGPTVPAEFRKVDRGSIIIESHAVIGANAVILPNICIGEGAAVGAGAVVTRDLEPWGIYAGVPARLIRPRRKDIIDAAEAKLYRQFGTPEKSYRRPAFVRFYDSLHSSHDPPPRRSGCLTSANRSRHTRIATSAPLRPISKARSPNDSERRIAGQCLSPAAPPA